MARTNQVSRRSFIGGVSAAIGAFVFGRQAQARSTQDPALPAADACVAATSPVEPTTPTRINVQRTILPMSSDINFPPGKTCRITGRPQSDFQAERIVIAQADEWIVNDVMISGATQIKGSSRPWLKDVPGRLFSSPAADSADIGIQIGPFDVCRADQNFVLDVTYVGNDRAGARFMCAIVGTTLE